ncbi:hypothetical protein ABZ372_49580, partial [Streptomyces sp. NPDC005921]
RRDVDRGRRQGDRGRGHLRRADRRRGRLDRLIYLDQADAPAVGQQVNDSVAGLIAGSKSPEDVTQAITKTAKEEQ